MYGHSVLIATKKPALRTGLSLAVGDVAVGVSTSDRTTNASPPCLSLFPSSLVKTATFYCRLPLDSVYFRPSQPHMDRKRLCQQLLMHSHTSEDHYWTNCSYSVSRRKDRTLALSTHLGTGGGAVRWRTWDSIRLASAVILVI